MLLLGYLYFCSGLPGIFLLLVGMTSRLEHPGPWAAGLTLEACEITLEHIGGPGFRCLTSSGATTAWRAFKLRRRADIVRSWLTLGRNEAQNKLLERPVKPSKPVVQVWRQDGAIGNSGMATESHGRWRRQYMSERWNRIGLIVNASAGKGVELAIAAARDALCRLGAQEVLTGPGDLGQVAVAGWGGRTTVHDVGAVVSRERTQSLAKWLAQQRPDALIVVGGDGTLADVAQIFIEQNCLVPLLGIGSGSTNVGRLITCRANEVWKLDPVKLEAWSVDCLTAHVNGELLGRAFNDVVIGYTVVGTIEGKLRDLDARERSRGKVVAAAPRSIATAESRVTRNARDGATIVAQAESVGTVVAGFAEPPFFGKAVCGGICLAALTGLPAGCLVSNLPLVQVEIDAGTVARTIPIVSSYVSLGEDITVMVEKVQEGAVLCVDGNPIRELSFSDRVEISVNEDAVRGVRFQKEQRPV